MIQPTVVTEVKDEKKKFAFRVRAYRKLTPPEFRAAYASWYRQRDKRRKLRNQVVEMISTIGYDE